MSRTRSAPGLLHSLRHRDFRLLIASFTASAVGKWAFNVALVAWLYQRTGSLTWITVAGVLRFLPGLLLSAYAGVLADRFEKVRLMVRADLLLALTLTAMAGLVALDSPAPLVLVLLPVTNALATVYEPGSAGLTPLVVPERDLGSANALRNTVENLSVLVGPGVGAVCLALGPPEVTFVLTAVTCVVSAACLHAVGTRSTPVDVTEGGEAGPLAQTVVGVRTIVASPAVAVMVGFCLLVTLVYGADTVLFVAISDRLLDTGPDGYGFLLAGLGVGGLLAAPFVTRAEARPSVGPVILAGLAAYCLPTLLLLVWPDPVLAFVVQVVRGAGTLFVDVLAITPLQRTLPAALMARVFGAFNALCVAAVLIGSALATSVVALGGVDAGLWFAGGVVFLLGLLGVPSLRGVDRSARERRAELAPRIALIETGGLFAAVPDGGLAQLAGAATEHDAVPGTAVVRQGEPADAVFVVASGTLQVTGRAPDGTTFTAPDLGPGAVFGEIGLLEQVPRTATVTAATEVRLLRIEGEAFLEALTTGTPSAALLDGAAARLRRTHPALTLHRTGPTTTEGAPG